MLTIKKTDAKSWLKTIDNITFNDFILKKRKKQNYKLPNYDFMSKQAKIKDNERIIPNISRQIRILKQT